MYLQKNKTEIYYSIKTIEYFTNTSTVEGMYLQKNTKLKYNTVLKL